MKTKVAVLELYWDLFMQLWNVAGVPQLPSPAGRPLWPTGCGSNRPQALDHHTLFHTCRLLLSAAREPDPADLQTRPRWCVACGIWFRFWSKTHPEIDTSEAPERTHLSGWKSAQLERLLMHLELACKHAWQLGRCWGCRLDQSDIYFGDRGSSPSVSTVDKRFLNDLQWLWYFCQND